MSGKSRSRTGKSIILAAALLMILLLAVNQAYAVGIVPAEKAIKYQPGKKILFDMDIMNNGQEELEVMLYAKGKHSEYISISEPVFKMTPEDEKKTVNIQFQMPIYVQAAGDQEIDIVAVGTTPISEGQEGVVKADVAVISKLILEIPYPETYAEADVHILDTEAGRPVQIALPMFNKGEKDIEQAYFKVDIVTSEKVKVEEIFSEKAALKAGESKKLTVTSKKELAAGSYIALVTFFYDKEMRGLERQFSVGELKIDIKSLVVDTFTLGGIARFDILLQNMWSTEMKNVYAEMQITDPDNKVYTDFKTVATDILPKQLGRLEGYWNTQGVAPGTYTARVTLHYANKITDRFFELDVLQDRIIVRDAVTGQAITSGEGGDVDIGNTGFLLVIIAVMALVIGVLVYKLRKRNIDKEPPATTARAAQGTAEISAQEKQTAKEKPK